MERVRGRFHLVTLLVLAPIASALIAFNIRFINNPRWHVADKNNSSALKKAAMMNDFDNFACVAVSLFLFFLIAAFTHWFVCRWYGEKGWFEE